MDQPTRKRAGLAALCVAGLFLVGCVGRMNDATATHDASSPPRRPPPDRGAPPSSSAPPEAPAPEPGRGCDRPPGAAPWRTTLLTREQYVNTVSDLLGFDVAGHVTFRDAAGRRDGANVTLSALAIEQRLNTAEAIAAVAAVPARWPGFLPCKPEELGETACATMFIEQFGWRAFRRPLPASATNALRAVFDAGKAAAGFNAGIEWVLAAVLQAPDFLYEMPPVLPAGRPATPLALDAATLASRLAFFLWNSGPDLALLVAARDGGLRGDAALAATVRRMLADPRAARMRADYYGTWLRLARFDEVKRDAPEFTPGLAASLRRSALEGVHQLYRSGAGIDALFGNATLWVDDPMAALYGLPVVGSPDLRAAESKPDERHGLLTHPALLTLLAHPDASDPIARGVFIEEEVLCQALPDPAPDIPELPPLRTGLSTRQRLEQHRSDPACAGCHQLFDPVGLAFESYDALGRYRTMDHGVPVDSSGELRQGLDVDGKFANGMELLARIGTSATVRDCLVRRSFEYALRRELDAADECALGAVKQRFRSSGDLVELLAAVAESDVFKTTSIEE
jgi:Protein of unknown function (DUF1588)/Protein of unknown function (DUF1592)/Protein of unknown function (DUF1595)/Protein of unknown function (DUF1585)/Protein of unknown function (DUF1587)